MMGLSGCGSWYCHFFSSHWAILDHIGKTEYRWIADFKRSTQHRAELGTQQPQLVFLFCYEPILYPNG